MNPDTIGCVWTGEFDLNTLRVDGEIFESGKKKLRIQIYPDTCGRGLRYNVVDIQRATTKCTKIDNAHADPLYSSLSLLFGALSLPSRFSLNYLMSPYAPCKMLTLYDRISHKV